MSREKVKTKLLNLDKLQIFITNKDEESLIPLPYFESYTRISMTSIYVYETVIKILYYRYTKSMLLLDAWIILLENAILTQLTYNKY